MRVLLIEDDLNKARHISATLREKFADVEIVEKHSYQSGLKEALQAAHDVIVLDMSMPTYDVRLGEEGGRSRPFAGRQILRKLERRGSASKVIVVTQFETFIDGTEEMTIRELEADLGKHFPETYVGTVFYQAGGSTWVKELTSLLSQAVGIRRRTR